VLSWYAICCDHVNRDSERIHRCLSQRSGDPAIGAAGTASDPKINDHPYAEASPRLAAGRVKIPCGNQERKRALMESGEFRRRYERKRYNSDVIFSLQGKAYAGTLKNISIGGAFVVTLSVNQVYQGDLITISIPFTDGKKNIKQRARVLWTNGEGFAVEFL
jgi:hypothetical protein